jgi:AraC-like DNA-binding protein
MAVVSTTADFASVRFSTKGLPPKERVPAWYDVFGCSVARRWCQVSDASCHVDMMIWAPARNGGEGRLNAGASVQRVTHTTGVTSQRTPELLTDGNDDISLNIQEAGRCIVSQHGREATAQAGAGFCMSNADTSTVVLPEPARFISIGLPRKLMMAIVPGMEDAYARTVPPDAGVLRLLMRYLDILEDDHALTPELQRAVATHIHDLCALAIGATRDAADIAMGRGLRAARLRAIKADIAQGLAKGHVSADMLAMRHRVTPRYIHKLFEGEGMTLSRFVLNQRLARIYRLLTDPLQGHRTIGALAFDVGFGDLSTFNREFRRHYGATPSDVRATTAK